MINIELCNIEKSLKLSLKLQFFSISHNYFKVEDGLDGYWEFVSLKNDIQ